MDTISWPNFFSALNQLDFWLENEGFNYSTFRTLSGSNILAIKLETGVEFTIEASELDHETFKQKLYLAVTGQELPEEMIEDPAQTETFWNNLEKET